jgi:hypothetical protein
VIQENSQSDEEKFVPEKLEAQKGPNGSEDAYDDREAIEAVRVKNLELKNKEEEIDRQRVLLETEKKRNEEAWAAKEALQKQKEEEI